MVLSMGRATVKQLKIRYCGIKFVAVLVMYYFMGTQVSAQLGLHYETMDRDFAMLNVYARVLPAGEEENSLRFEDGKIGAPANPLLESFGDRFLSYLDKRSKASPHSLEFVMPNAKVVGPDPLLAIMEFTNPKVSSLKPVRIMQLTHTSTSDDRLTATNRTPWTRKNSSFSRPSVVIGTEASGKIFGSTKTYGTLHGVEV